MSKKTKSLSRYGDKSGRTTRNYPQPYYKLRGKLYCSGDYTCAEWSDMQLAFWEAGVKRFEDFGCKDGRDCKPRYKPCKSFKRINRKSEKAKVKQAIHRMMCDPDGDTIIPDFPDSDIWDWD